MTDISREMVEHLCHIHRGYEQHGTVAMLLSLRAAIDAAEADKRQAVLDAVSLACDHLTAMADLCDLMEPDATGGKTLRSAAAAIRNQGEPK